MRKIPIALQLYSVRKELIEDAPGTLEAVAGMGYAGVEFAGVPKHEASELRRMLADNGLVCCGWHVPYALVQQETLAETIAFHQELGNSRLIIPSLPKEQAKSQDDWKRLGGFLSDLAETLKPLGMETGYHNHGTEFEPLAGQLPWDIVAANSPPEVILQFDIGNALDGTIDTEEVYRVIERYPNRGKTIHIKPSRRESEAGFRPLVGEDELDWQRLLALCAGTAGTEWYIIEYETAAYPALEAVQHCLTSLQQATAAAAE